MKNRDITDSPYMCRFVDFDGNLENDFVIYSLIFSLKDHTIPFGCTLSASGTSQSIALGSGLEERGHSKSQDGRSLKPTPSYFW